MEDHDRELAERLHSIVTANAPDLAPKLWYGQPAYARGGKVVCFFRSGADDKERYSTFGFTPEANLDAAAGVWPTRSARSEERRVGKEGRARMAQYHRTKKMQSDGT